MTRVPPPDFNRADGRTARNAEQLGLQLYYIARELEIMNDTLEAMARDQ